MERKNLFARMCLRWTNSWLPLAMSSVLCTSFLAGHHDAKKEHLKCRESSLTLVTPIKDYLFAYDRAALSDLFSPLLPDLSSITFQYNTYYSPILVVNPTNENNLVIFYGHDESMDSSGNYQSGSNGGPSIAHSKNGGKTWSHALAALPEWLGGTIGQSIGSNFLPLSFSQKGTLYFSGFSDQSAPLPSAAGNTALNFVFVTESEDGGKSWSDPIIIAQGASGIFPAAPGGGINFSGTGSIFVDKVNDEIIHVGFSSVDLGHDTLYGNIFYSRSLNRGKNWEPARQIYSLATDPRWVKAFYNPNDSFFALGGGQCIGGVLAEVASSKHHDKSVLLISMLRLYPQPDATTYTQTVTDSLFDHAVIRSTDHGKTWSQKAIQIAPYTLAFSHNPNVPGVFDLISFDGSLFTPIAVSPKTQRVYAAWQGANFAVSSDPSVAQFFPNIQMSSSSDAGLHWAPVAQVNRTPLNSTIMGASQAFNVNFAITEDGYVGIIYADFRNYNGSTDNVATDVWLDIYKEVKDPQGGNTGIGLEFVKEVRLTSESFNALVGFDSVLDGVGSINGIAVRNGQFVTAFGITNQDDVLPMLKGPDGVKQDVNHRISVFFEKVKCNFR